MQSPGESMTISVVTPSYNQGEYIERTLRSVLEQDHPSVEYLVMDGGSTDDTVSILERYDDRLSGWVSEPDRGQAHAVNKGFQRATGDLVGWLNSDDQYFSPDVLSSVARFFATHPDVDVVYGDNIYVDEEDRLLFYRRAYPAFSPGLLRHWNFIHQPTVFFRRRVVDRHLLREELHYVMDYELWMRLADADVRFGYLPKVLAASRWHSDCKTHQAGGESVFREVQEVYKEYPRSLSWLQPRLAHSAMFTLQRLVSLGWLGVLAARGRFDRFRPSSWLRVVRRHLVGARLGT